MTSYISEDDEEEAVTAADTFCVGLTLLLNILQYMLHENSGYKVNGMCWVPGTAAMLWSNRFLVNDVTWVVSATSSNCCTPQKVSHTVYLEPGWCFKMLLNIQHVDNPS